MLVIFVATRAAGDPAELLLPADATQAQVDLMRQQIGTDRSYVVQFGVFLKGMVTFDFGRSVQYLEPVSGLLGPRIAASLKLQFASLLFILATALPFGVYAATHRGMLPDRVVRIIAAFGQAAPGFWVGLMLMFIFAVRIGWVPAGGMGDGGIGSWKFYILPTITASLLNMAAMTRLLRSAMLETLDSEFVKLARAKGLSERRVVWVHVFRNAQLPIMTYMAIWIGTAVSGSVVTETVFDWPGIGAMFINAILNRDFPIIQAVTALIAAAVLSANLGADLLYAVVDPRIRLGVTNARRAAAGARAP